MKNDKPEEEAPPATAILIVDDDEGMCYTLARMVQEEGFEARTAGTVAEGLSLALSQAFDVIFLDVRLPDGSGLSCVPAIQAMPRAPEIIIITGYGDKGGAKAALQSGVWDYIEKPARISDLRLSLKRALQYRRQKASFAEPLTVDRCGILGHSSKLFMCLVLMSHAAKTDASVLIGGETGTGKELLARAIHQNSARADHPFVVVDCAALPQTLAESILFGHVQGAFTGAEKARQGLIKKADGGTLFLDEVGELPPAMQKTFLRVLQEKTCLPVGGNTEVGSNFRLISATNRDLESDVEQKRFRRDLFFRLRTFMIELPALRDRKKDIRDIVVHTVETFGERSGGPAKHPSQEFLDVLMRYHWPGNVRELINTVESALAMEPACPTLYPKHLPEYIRAQHIRQRTTRYDEPHTAPTALMPAGATAFPALKPYRAEAIAKVERDYLERLVEHCRSDMDKACAVSGLKRARLYQLLKQYGIRKPDA